MNSKIEISALDKVTDIAIRLLVIYLSVIIVSVSLRLEQ